MNKTYKLKPVHLISVTALFNTSLILVFKGFTESGNFHWITPFFSGILALLCSLALFSVSKKYPGKTIYEVLDILFPKWISVFLGGIYAVYATYLLSIILRNTGILITTVSLDKTPQFLIQLIIIFICVYALINGISVFGRFSIVSLIVTIFAVLITFIMSFSNIDTESFLPIIPNGFNNTLSDILSYFIVPFAENILLYNIYSEAEDHKKNYKCFAIGFGIATVIICAVLFLTLSVLGISSLNKLFYPFYTTVSVIKSGNFFSRMEIIISASLVLNLLTKLCVCFYAAIGFLKHRAIFKKEWLNYLSIALISLLISILLPSTNDKIRETLDIYLIWAPFIQLIIPSVMVIGMIIKNRTTSIKKLNS